MSHSITIFVIQDILKVQAIFSPNILYWQKIEKYLFNFKYHFGCLKDAFISYSSKNSQEASKIKEELENYKFSIWLDTSELQYGVLLRD